jgi:3D (Asp-Asp-Asp) domain-containing protein
MKKIIIKILILTLLISASISALYIHKQQLQTVETDTRFFYENQLEEKNNQINTLETEKIALNQQITDLNNTIAELKSKKVTTSRSTSETREVATTDKWIWANVSAYCACIQCCGKTNGITASGTQATANRTIAASSAYPFGTKIEIEGMGIYTVEDRGGAITGNKIDIYFDSHQEALQFGRRNLQIKVVE